ncbi:MAG: hypothetical protein O7G86_08625 [Gammaproteobacteria bacterium]|nr:hypothetical protein [Gammaproteobacteria bacterium]
MNAALSLIKREWLEHKTGFGWAPIGVLGTLVVLTVLVLIFTNSTRGVLQVSFDRDSAGNTTEQINISLGDDVSDDEVMVFQALLSGMFDYSDWSDEELSASIDKARSSVALPFQLVYFLVAIFALLGSLHEDRRDRTVLFWKSMPVSDSETVLAKLLHVAWVAPVVTILAILVAEIFLLLVVSAVAEGGLWKLWSNSGLIMELLELTFGYALQGLWALPIYGWLLLVSVSVNRVPFVWAVLVPIVPAVLETVLFSTSILREGVVNHLRFVALPSAASFSNSGFEPAVHLDDQLGLLASSEMWIGVVIGACFVAAAIYMRHRNNEI